MRQGGRVVLLLVVLMLFLLIFPIYHLAKAFWVSSEITLHHVSFWGILVLFPLVLWQICKSRRIPFSVDLRFAIPIWIAFLFVYYTTGLFYFSGIADNCKINAQVMGGEWEESYTKWRTEEVCDSKDKNGNCTSSHEVKHCDDYESDSYEIKFSDNSTHSIGSNNYKNLVFQLKNEKKVPVIHIDQCSVGDGRKYETSFIPGKSNELYVSYEIPVVNYILAGANLYQTSSEVAKPYEKLLKPIPKLVEHESGIGLWRTHRVLVSEVNIPQKWITDTDNTLNKITGTYGPSKEVDILVYLVGKTNREFAVGLDAYWVHGKKNQLTIIIGSNNFPEIEWVDVIDFWSTNKNVGIDIRDKLQQVKLDDPEFTEIIKQEMIKNWSRMEMASLSHLAWDLTIPFWSYILIVVWVSLATIFFSKSIPSLLAR